MTPSARLPRPLADARARYLDELSALLWPAPAAVAIGPRERHDGQDPTAEEYFVLPHARHPRLVVPRQGRPAAAAVGGFNRGRSRRARLLSGPLSLALRGGAGGALLRDRLVVREPGDSLRAYLREVLGQDVLISFQLGAPRANQKPVIQLVGRRGACAGYAKLGVNELTKALVRHEAAALHRLASAGPQAVTVPKIQHIGRWRDTDVLVLEPLPVRRRPPARLPGALLQAAMTEVAGINGVTLAPLAESPYWGGLLAGLLETGPPGEPFRAVLDRASERVGGTVLAFGSWHGDWTRSNVAPRGHTVLAWDWERFGTGVPVGFDALHYHLHNEIGTAHRPPELAARRTVSAAGDLLLPFGVQSAESARLTAALYLAELALRYLWDRQDAAGARLGEPRRWLLPGLAAAAAERA